MCLAVPGQVICWLDRDPTFARAVVEFAGIRRECHMACVPEAEVGDYVVVHAGIAISRIDAAAAQLALDAIGAAAEPEVVPPQPGRAAAADPEPAAADADADAANPVRPR